MAKEVSGEEALSWVFVLGGSENDGQRAENNLVHQPSMVGAARIYSTSVYCDVTTYLWLQWQADMTLVAEMREPPQKWLPLTWREACHGAKEVEVTSSPPTILLSQ